MAWIEYRVFHPIYKLEILIIILSFNIFSVVDYDEFFQDPSQNSSFNQKPLVPQKTLRRLGIDTLYEKSLRYLRKIHDIALDPQADLYLNDKLHNSVTYLKGLRKMPEYEATAKSDRYIELENNRSLRNHINIMMYCNLLPFIFSFTSGILMQNMAGVLKKNPF